VAVETGVARKPYASDPRASRGRLFAEADGDRRNPFRRDCDRVIHSTAFRRLKHKTQVFVEHEGDHYRTRLTHTLEVAQIARSIARALGLDEDLAEALSLAHDLGHTPFGHAGERALDKCLSAVGGFDHNAQSLRILTRLERRYADFDGLNLTWETLEGLVKHNGPQTDRQGTAVGPHAVRGIPVAVRTYADLHDLELWSQPGPEAQVAALSDDIAYDVHDIDDGLRAGLFTLDHLTDLPLVGPTLAAVRDRYPGLEPQRIVAELMRRLITRMIADVIDESETRLAALRPDSAAAVRAATEPVIAFSTPMAGADRAIKGFLYPRMYRHPRVEAIMQGAEDIVTDLYAALTTRPAALPAEWRAGFDDLDEARRARRIGDFIAGMTDRFARQEHARLFDTTPALR
jgi:dGTPase